MKNFTRNTIQSQKVFYRYIRRKGWKRFFKENILESDGSNKKKALSIALGIFVGISPIWGFHTVAVLFLATYFRLNKMLSYLGTQVSFPPLIPFIIALSLYFGAPFVDGNTLFENQEFNFALVKSHMLQYIIGSMILATVSGAFFGLTSYFLMEKFNPDK